MVYDIYERIMTELLKDKQDIIDWLENYGVENYTLVADTEYGFMVDVDGMVFLSYSKLESIKIKFNVVTGAFYCSNNQLNNLLGAPNVVGGSFECQNNQLTTLEGGPESAGGNYYCQNNLLTSLQYCPKTILAGFEFCCSNNRLLNLDYIEGFSSDALLYCQYNAALGDYENMRDIDKIKNKLIAQKEYKSLSTALSQAKPSTVQKI